MPSNSNKTSIRRERRDLKKGKAGKKARNQKGTPKFPIQPEGDKKSQDASS